MADNQFLDVLSALNQASRQFQRAGNLYAEIHKSEAKQQFIDAQQVASQRLNKFLEDIQYDPDFGKTVDQLWEENEGQMPSVHPHNYTEKYEQFWTGGEADQYWQSGGKAAEIFNEIAEKYTPNPEARQQFENWYAQQSEQVRQNVVEFGYQRKADQMILDLQNSLNGPLMQMENDERAIDMASERISSALDAGVIDRKQAEGYMEAFQTQKLFNTAREEAVNVMNDHGYSAARKFAQQDDLPITQEGRKQLLEFIDSEWKQIDKAIRKDVDEAESDFINGWAQGELTLSDVVNDPRLRGGHSYANDIKMRWIEKIEKRNKAAEDGKLDPNEVSDPRAEQQAHELFSDPYLSTQQYQTRIRELTSRPDGGLSVKRGNYWLEKSSTRESDDIVNPIYQSSIDLIKNHYQDLIENTNDQQKQAKLRQQMFKKMDKLQSVVTNPEYREMLKRNNTDIAKIADNLISDVVQYKIDAISGYEDFQIDASWLDASNYNDVEKLTRAIQDGDLMGREVEYEEPLLRYEKGLRKLGNDVFDKDFTLFREKGGHFTMLFESYGVGQEQDKYLLPSYHGKSGFLVQFRIDENSKDLVPKIWHPDFGTWRDIPKHVEDWLSPPTDEERERRERRRRAVESFNEHDTNPMGGTY